MADVLTDAVVFLRARTRGHTDDSEPNIPVHYIRTILAALEAAEARERAKDEALTSIRTQADNAAYNAHRSGITIDNAQLVRIFEGMEKQAARALTPETTHAE